MFSKTCEYAIRATIYIASESSASKRCGIRDIAIDGNDLFDRCSLGLHDCSDKQPCPFHHKYKPLRENLKKTLRETSLLDLISEFNTGETFLKL